MVHTRTLCSQLRYVHRLKLLLVGDLATYPTGISHAITSSVAKAYPVTDTSICRV